MVASSFGKQTANCDSPHDWLMSLSMDLVTCGGDNGINESHLAVFREDVPFTCHFVASHHPPLSHPVVVPMVLVTPVKNYLKWQEIQLTIQCTADTVN